MINRITKEQLYSFMSMHGKIVTAWEVRKRLPISRCLECKKVIIPAGRNQPVVVVGKIHLLCETHGKRVPGYAEQLQQYHSTRHAMAGFLSTVCEESNKNPPQDQTWVKLVNQLKRL